MTITAVYIRRADCPKVDQANASVKVLQKQRPRGRLWLSDGSCVRLRPERKNHVWSYGFVSTRAHNRRTLRMLTLIDEYSRKCLAIPVARRPNSYDLIETVACVILWNGIPEHIRSDNGPEFVAMELQKWLASMGAKTLDIEPGLSRRTDTVKASAESCREMQGQCLSLLKLTFCAQMDC